MDSHLQPLEETKQILKQSIIDYLGNITDEQMVPNDAERKAFRETSPLREEYALGMCKLLMYLLNLQYGACRDPNNLTSVEDAVVTEIQLMESKLPHQLPNHLRKKKFEDIGITNLHPGLAKCFLESLLELESALQNKYNETKAEEERREATAAKNRLKKQRRRDRKLQASAEPENQVEMDDSLDKKDVVTKQASAEPENQVEADDGLDKKDVASAEPENRGEAGDDLDTGDVVTEKVLKYVKKVVSC
ncbi:hypothetical protein OROMI_016717 [Orobanche minor]